MKDFIIYPFRYRFLLMNQGNGRGSFKKMKKVHLGGLGSRPGRSLKEKAPSPGLIGR